MASIRYPFLYADCLAQGDLIIMQNSVIICHHCKNVAVLRYLKMMEYTYYGFNMTEPNEVLCKKSCTVTSTAHSCMRLYNIAGFDNRKNDIIYCRPDTGLSEKSVVVFFGGDVQDFVEKMEKNKQAEEFLKWNLESTADLLRTSFPGKHVVVVRPSRMDFNTYSCYKNFVPVIKYGAPEHRPMNNALQHLDCLLKEVTSNIRLSFDEEASDVAELNESDLLLIGFSKGCVVLNQFLYEFHYVKTLTPDDESTLKIIDKIKDMYWLDGGHSGGKNTWITSRSLLQTLANLGIKVHVHVTPYQICDNKRPWIGKEEKQFTGLLREMNADVERVFHFEEEEENFASLSTHFEVLTVFRQPHPHPYPVKGSIVSKDQT